MRKSFKKALISLLCISVLLSCANINSVFAEDAAPENAASEDTAPENAASEDSASESSEAGAESGTDPDNISWTLSEEGLLTISGTGEMGAFDENELPWSPADVYAVYIEYGLASIGEKAFYNCSSLTTISIPASVTVIGQAAFSGCSSLTSVNYAGPECQWGYINIADDNEPLIAAAQALQGHSLEYAAEKAADCTTDGNIAYYRCTLCDTHFEADGAETVISDKSSVIIPALGHDFSVFEDDEAQHWLKCSRCDEKKENPYWNAELSGSFTLNLSLLTAAGYENAGCIINDSDTLAEAPCFTIAEYASFNRDAGKSDIPAFPESSYFLSVSEGYASLVIETPNYSSSGAGDYWYTISESIDTAAGLNIVGANPRYLLVRVAWDEELPMLKLAGVEIHSAAPDSGTEGDVISAEFTISYGTGELVIYQTAAGNMGDPDKPFALSLTFTAPEGKEVKNAISCIGGFDSEGNPLCESIDEVWTEKVFTVYLKHCSSVCFSGIPDGVSYEISENGDGYELSYAVDGVLIETAEESSISGVISDSRDIVSITSTKNVEIDIGPDSAA